ncbi:MAG: arginine--tRNA ligase, partial [Caldimicrobium sp.]
RRKIKEKLYDILKELYEGSEEITFEVETPKHKNYGDYSTNLALVLGGKIKDDAKGIAQKIVQGLSSDPFFTKIEIAGPGFINFWINQEVYLENLRKILIEEENYGNLDLGRGKRVIIEFVSANPTGPLHIGHGRGAAYGDALARLFKKAGFNVLKEYYINDRGTQIDILGTSVYLRAKEISGIAVNFPEDYYQGAYIYDIAKEALRLYPDLLAREESEAIRICKELAIEIILKDIKEDLERFRVYFDNWYSEKSLYERGLVKECINVLKGKDLIYEKDGAFWFKSSIFGDEKDRVIRKATGEWTYFASDISYHYEKFVKRGFHIAINLWGADHHGYVARLKGAVEALNLDPKNLKIILIQMVNLIDEGKIKSMSTRKAEYVELKELLREVGVDAVRFIFLSRSADSPLDFDVELAKKQTSENPVYYVQYAHARICSIFEKAQLKGLDLHQINQADLSLLKEKEEVEILKKLSEFSDEVEMAVNQLAPYKITYYLLDLAGLFHEYYNKFRIVGEDKSLSFARLSLAKGCQILLKEGLNLLGIDSPNKM